MISPTKVNGKTNPNHFVVDELDYLKNYTKEQIEKLWKSALPEINDIFKDYKPYIVYLGNIDGIELYQVNSDDKFSYITNKSGAEEADKALREVAKLYYNKE